MNNIPNSLSKFFWDTRFADINPDKNQDYIIARLLRLGDEEAWKWLTETYSSDKIEHVIKNSRELSLKDTSFFGLIYKIDPMEIRCTNQA